MLKRRLHRSVFFRLVPRVGFTALLLASLFGFSNQSSASDSGTRAWSLVTSSFAAGGDIHRRPYMQQALVGGLENGNYHTFWRISNRNNDVQNRIYWRLYNNAGVASAAKLVAGGPNSPAGAVEGPTTLPMADDSGGIYFSYASSIGLGFPAKSYVQRLDETGTALWGTPWTSPNLPQRSTGDEFHYILNMKSHPSGGVVILYRLENSLPGVGSGHDLYVQYINATGVAQWGTYGKRVSTGQYPMASYRYGQFVEEGAGEFYVYWNSGTQILVQKLDTNGNTVWGTPTLVADRAGASLPSVVRNSDSSMTFTWSDTHQLVGGNPRGGIYAQRVSSAGSLLWGANGVTVFFDSTPGETDSLNPHSVQDEQGGSIIAWQHHGGVSSGMGYAMAQRIDQNGAPLWAAAGVPLHIPAVSPGKQSGVLKMTYNPITHRAYFLYPKEVQLAPGKEALLAIDNLDDADALRVEEFTGRVEDLGADRK